MTISGSRMSARSHQWQELMILVKLLSSHQDTQVLGVIAFVQLRSSGWFPTLIKNLRYSTHTSTISPTSRAA